MGPVLSFWLQCNEINLTNMAESALKMHLDRTAVWLSEPLLTSLTANCKCNAPPVCTSGKQRQTETRHPDVFYSMFYIKVKLYTIESPIFPILETNVWDHGLIRKLFFFFFYYQGHFLVSLHLIWPLFVPCWPWAIIQVEDTLALASVCITYS